MYIKKKIFVLIVTYLSAAAIAFGAYSAALSVNGANYRNTAVYGYEHAFGEVVTASAKLSDALHRGAYATGAEMSASVCADVYGNCLAAGMTMSALPFSTQELENTAKFISVAADYAQSLMKQTGGFDDTARKNFAELYKTSESITNSLNGLRDDIDNGEVIMDEPENVFTASGGSLMSSAMLEMESGLGELPELDYDGKYTKEKPQDCKDPISEDKARGIAADFLGVEGDKLQKQYRSENGATSFEYEDKSVLVDGFGNVLSLSSSRVVTGEMSSENMEKAAREFLKKQGLNNLHLASSERVGDVQVMRFECLAEGVRCEADSVKISIAADDGKVYAYDASGHINSPAKHTEPESIVTQTEAKNALPEGLSVKQSGMVYAETDGGSERLCYDFECKTESGDTLRVLVDAESGSQYRIDFE